MGVVLVKCGEVWRERAMTTPSARTEILLIKNDQHGANSIPAALSRGVAANGREMVRWISYLTTDLSGLADTGNDETYADRMRLHDATRRAFSGTSLESF
jgi:hypothetical protein